MTAELDPDAVAFTTARMIAEAKARGTTWAQIASALGLPNAGAAKAHAKKLAKQANAAVLRAGIEEDS